VNALLFCKGRTEEISGTSWLKGAIDIAGALVIGLDSDSMGYILTNNKQGTNVLGIYAAGDICGPPRFPRPWGKVVWQDFNAVDFNVHTVSQKKTGTVDFLLRVCMKMSLSKGIPVRRLSENGYFPQSLCQAQIIILEILQCIPVVIIFAFRDLGKKYFLLRHLLR